MTLNRPKTRRPTIYDVARQAGVSPSLFSLVLQNPVRVSEKRREAVQAAISDLGYRPSRAATTLASSRTKSIGLVIDDYRNLWFVDLLRGMESALTEHGYQVMLADSRPGENRIREAVDGLLAMHVDGLVIAAEPSASMLGGVGVPTVVAGWRDGVPAGADLITNDDDGGGAMAADHLLGLGHRRIGHLTGLGGAAAHRREGFRARLQEAGAEQRIVGGCGWHVRGGRLRLGVLAAGPPSGHHRHLCRQRHDGTGGLRRDQGARPGCPGRHLRNRLRQLNLGKVAISGSDVGGQP